MKILVTGADGFIGKTLCIRAAELNHSVVSFIRSDSPRDFTAKLAGVEAVIHLAGINRPLNEGEFTTGNADLTQALCHAIAKQTSKPMLLLASSTQAAQDNAYGRSKLAAEQAVRDLNYGKFVEQGESQLTEAVDYNSHNTARLDVDGMKALLLKLAPIQRITQALQSGQPLAQVLAAHGVFGD